MIMVPPSDALHNTIFPYTQSFRSGAAVYARAGFLDLTDVNPPDWTEWEDAQLGGGYRRGVPLRQVGTLIGRPLGGISSRAGLLGIVHAHHPPCWSDEETARALHLAEIGRAS